MGAWISRYHVNALGGYLSADMKLLIKKYTGNNISAAIIGMVFSMITGGENTFFAYTTASFVASELLTFSGAVQLLNWSSVGASALYYLAAIHIEIVYLFFTGISCLLFFFCKSNKRQAVYGLIAGVALILYGTGVVKSIGQDWTEISYVHDIIQASTSSWFYVFILGLAVRLIFQLGWLNLIISMIMLESKVFDIEDMMVLGIGTRAGTAFAIWRFQKLYQSPAKQIFIFQAIWWLTAAALALGSLFIEYQFHIPLFGSFIRWSSSNPQVQVVNFGISVHVVTALILSFFLPCISQFITRFEPFDDNKGHFIFSGIIQNPSLALDLWEKELIGILSTLNRYTLSILQSDSLIKLNKESKTTHELFSGDFQKIKNYSVHIIRDCNISIEDYEIFNKLLNQQNMIESLEISLHEWTQAIGELIFTLSGHELPILQVEAWDALYQEVNQAIQHQDKESLKNLLQTTMAKKELMTALKNYWNNTIGDKPREQALFLKATRNFEINTWLMRKLIITELESVEHTA